MRTVTGEGERALGALVPMRPFQGSIQPPKGPYDSYQSLEPKSIWRWPRCRRAGRHGEGTEVVDSAHRLL